MTLDSRRIIAVVTGTRAEYGLLRPVMRAVAADPKLTLRVVVTGTHLLGPQNTVDEVAADFPIAASIPMQTTSRIGRASDAEALGRGIVGFAELLAHDPPDVVVVLGDRIEAFAAAAAAAVAGVRVAHMHGGDRAEGIADESLRHAITKLAHIHLPATQTSAQRIIAMGEDSGRVHVVGSPAMDGLADIEPISDDTFKRLGSPRIIVLLHPVGDDDQTEHERAAELIRIASAAGPTLLLHPNHDPGRNGIMRAIEESRCEHRTHLPREAFFGLLRRSSAGRKQQHGLIEAAAAPIRVINVGRRQSGREMPANVTDIPDWDYQTIRSVLNEALSATMSILPDHPYGDGRAGLRTAALLAGFDPAVHGLSKRNSY